MPESSRRKQSWELICKLATLSTLPWCVMGDFNDLLYSTDKEGIHPHPEHLMRGFRHALDMSSLSEVELSGGRFTWERGRGTSAWVRERLDRAFANSNWWSLFPLCNLTVVSTPVSDHEALFLKLVETTMSKKVFRFKFENTWLKDPSFISDVKNCWENLPVSHLMLKLMSVSRFMEKWGRDFFNKFKEKVRRQKAILDSLRERTDDHSVKEYLAVRDKLNETLLHEEMYWKQRAKLFWLKEGDENTRFFHASATARKKANRINFLVNDDGVRIDKAEDMGELIKDYYQRVFEAPTEVGSNISTSSPRIVNQMQNQALTADVSYEEFSVAMSQMHPDKASGPDGLNPAFYQNFWKVLGKDVFECCRDWLQGRCITDNVVVAFELIHHMRGDKRGSEGENQVNLQKNKDDPLSGNLAIVRTLRNDLMLLENQILPFFVLQRLFDLIPKNASVGYPEVSLQEEVVLVDFCYADLCKKVNDYHIPVWRWRRVKGYFRTQLSIPFEVIIILHTINTRFLLEISSETDSPLHALLLSSSPS
nr:PREDICTED: uncharacterized protein LOC108217129 [Daucus carota subsp. sativus]